MINIKYEYKTIRDIPVTILTRWEEKVSNGTEAILPINSRLKISLDYNPGDQYLRCDLINGCDFEKSLIPDAERKKPGYGGISISLKLSDLKTHCVPVSMH